MKKKILLGVVVALIAIQFVRPARNLGPAEPGPNDITTLHPTSPEVKAILAKACYDCHSDRTRYPWYADVQPVGWWLANHVDEGRHHLNFSQFGTLPANRAARKMSGFVRLVRNGKMPLSSYTWEHRDAILTDAERKALIDWAEAIHASLAAKK